MSVNIPKFQSVRIEISLWHGSAKLSLKKNTDEAIATLDKALTPLRLTLEHQPYIGGAEPSFADYIVFVAFQFARVMCPIKLLASEDLIYAWRDHLLDAFNGYARNAPGYTV